MRRPLQLLFVAMAGTPAAFAAAPSGEELFVRRIQPLFEDKCLACHGKDEAKIKAGFDLRTREDMMKGGDSELPAIVPGEPAKSPLYLAVTREHEDWEPMPPKANDALTKDQIADLSAWISAGAPWPNKARVAELKAQGDKWSAQYGVTVKTSGGLSADWTDRHYKPEDLWALQPLRKPPVPGGGDRETERPGDPEKGSTSVASSPHPSLTPSPRRATHPIDAFLNAKLADMKLAPAPAADRATLIRRATFDLIGLPPTPEEIAAFVADPSGDAAALAKVVERLLASPHYGEQWGRHWLDVTRYADSSGFANDFTRGNTWRYRDYVIRAFNADKPYTEFIREQIAGDELAAQRSGAAAAEARIAAGFLRMGPWELTGMEVAKVARQKFLDDVTDSVGQVFLAQPLQCARCHDHKFDPIATRDYYSFQAIFATTQLAEEQADFLPEENRDGFEERKYLEQRQEHYRGVIERLEQKSIVAARAWYAEKKIDPAAFEAALADSGGKKGGRSTRYSGARTELMRKGIPESEIPPKLAGFTPEDYGIERIARKGLERLRWDFERYEPIAFTVYSGRTPELRAVLAPQRMPAGRMTAGELEATHILTGGDPFADGAPVVPRVLTAPSVVGAMKWESPEAPATIDGRRRVLADWIASPDNPLAPRVIVNRVWLWHFGRALAGNPNNFGATGKKPTHPELLDWLAATFVSGDAPNSIKALHRLIMSSEAYRRAAAHPDPRALAERDPLGTSYAVFQPRRMAAEELRDAMLAVTGELNRTLGGIPARPEINREAALQPRQVMGTFAEAWQPSPKPEQRHRRTVYVQKVRGLADPFMEVFNAPSPDLSCEARDASTVTPQVFALFNSESTYDRALALAARVRKETTAPDAAIARVFQLALGRAPTREEAAKCRQHWDQMTARHRTLTFAASTPPREVVREAVEENTGEKFRFVEPLEAMADFVPDLKPSDAPPETRGLAEVCVVLFNSNEFVYVY
ncbi:MAG TPA: PSD1 and planctomycete cytochrome C domain-containing protein [Opitutaceae bacterium]|nr:PSD1 and planctomycete cytochrome C domain-containing protein [Opitutaceae bacterium]